METQLTNIDLCETCTERHCNGCINKNHYKGNINKENSQFRWPIITPPNQNINYWVMDIDANQRAISYDGINWLHDLAEAPPFSQEEE